VALYSLLSVCFFSVFSVVKIFWGCVGFSEKRTADSVGEDGGGVGKRLLTTKLFCVS